MTPGFPLPPLVRWRTERLLGVPFDDVHVETSAAARRMTEALGTLACAVDRRILLHPDAPAGSRPVLLAHELVHLAQQRLPPAAPADAARAEAEAHAGAAALLAGRPFRCRVAMPPAQPLGWNEPGHYYTVYLLALAVGFGSDTAFQIAVYCQLPDMAAELDAGVAGVPQVQAIPVVGQLAQFGAFTAPVLGKVSSSVENLGRFSDQAARSAPMDMSMRQHIQRGLHAFTGRTAGVETNFRRRLISRITPRGMDMVDYGLALHTLGDSYAHRTDDDDMCTIPFGHAFSGGAERDDIGPDTAALYMRYATTLHESLLGTAKALTLTPRSGFDGILKGGLETMTRNNYNRREQIVRFRNLATQIGQSMHAFEPNNDNLVPFAALASHVPGASLSEAIYLRALECARKWSLADGYT